MYQKFVLGLGILLLVGLGYYIYKTDDGGVLTQSLSGDGATSTSQVPTDSLPGIYFCTSESGCKDEQVLTLSEDNTAKLSTSFENGAEVLEETGVWSSQGGRRLTVTLDGANGQTYEAPHVISVGRIQADSLSSILFDQSIYDGWQNPHFIRGAEL